LAKTFLTMLIEVVVHDNQMGLLVGVEEKRAYWIFH
jgi:hypothetical protein